MASADWKIILCTPSCFTLNCPEGGSALSMYNVQCTCMCISCVVIRGGSVGTFRWRVKCTCTCMWKLERECMSLCISWMVVTGGNVHLVGGGSACEFPCKGWRGKCVCISIWRLEGEYIVHRCIIYYVCSVIVGVNPASSHLSFLQSPPQLFQGYTNVQCPCPCILSCV